MIASRLLGAALLLTWTAAAVPPDETDRLLLADPTLPRLERQPPVPSATFLLELSPVEPGLGPVRARLDTGRPQLVEVPGCEALARLFVLPVDPSEGTRRLVFPGALTTACGSGFPAFVDLVPGAEPVPVPVCGRYRASERPEALPDGEGVEELELSAVSVDPAVPRLEAWLLVRLLERHAEGGETVRVRARVPFVSDRAFALQATWAHHDGAPLSSRFFIGGGTLAVAEEGAEIAVTASFVREVSDGERALAVRVARQEGWWLARWGETAVKTLSPPREGIGELVVELTALRGGPPPVAFDPVVPEAP